MVTIKTEKEIEYLKVGGKHLKALLTELALLAVPGTSTEVFEDKARKLIEEMGDKTAILGYTPAGARRSYPASTCISINDEIVHGIPNENPKKLKEGDIVSIDAALIHGGMYVDSAITVGVGQIPPEAELLIQATEAALAAGISAARGGAYIGDIGAAIEAVALEKGFSLAEDLCGHGVGYSVHEDPYVPNWGKLGEGLKLEPGMVIAIEPMLVAANNGKKFSKIKLDSDGYTYRTKDGSISAHFEHTVVITKDEPIVVTK
jgi:methionyl aminopeptidase